MSKSENYKKSKKGNIQKRERNEKKKREKYENKKIMKIRLRENRNNGNVNQDFLILFFAHEISQ